MSEPPPPHVLTAFGASGVPQPLAGGTGRSWRAGALVLKALDRAPAELAWQVDTFTAVRPVDVRLVPPLAAVDGEFVVDGWTAWRYERGAHEVGRWAEIIEVGDRLHRALAGVPRPDALIDPRTDPWDTGDRVAWSEQPVEPFFHVRHVRTLAGLRRPLDARRQLVHGDLTGNVLFADGLAPAVIDFAPYWRPPAYAAAIVVGDALLWEGADERLLAAVRHVERLGQFLARALIYRLVTHAIFSPTAPDFPDEAVLRTVRLAAQCVAWDRGS